MNRLDVSILSSFLLRRSSTYTTCWGFPGQKPFQVNGLNRVWINCIGLYEEEKPCKSQTGLSLNDTQFSFCPIFFQMTSFYRTESRKTFMLTIYFPCSWAMVPVSDIHPQHLFYVFIPYPHYHNEQSMTIYVLSLNMALDADMTYSYQSFTHSFTSIHSTGILTYVHAPSHIPPHMLST